MFITNIYYLIFWNFPFYDLEISLFILWKNKCLVKGLPTPPSPPLLLVCSGISTKIFFFVAASLSAWERPYKTNYVRDCAIFGRRNTTNDTTKKQIMEIYFFPFIFLCTLIQNEQSKHYVSGIKEYIF